MNGILNLCLLDSGKLKKLIVRKKYSWELKERIVKNRIDNMCLSEYYLGMIQQDYIQKLDKDFQNDKQITYHFYKAYKLSIAG